jgi:hypothetical protein
MTRLAYIGRFALIAMVFMLLAAIVAGIVPR